MSDTKFDRIILLFRILLFRQTSYVEYDNNIEFHKRLPHNEDYTNNPRPKLIFFYDLA